mgnify:CR=1 FL=1
MSEQFAYGIGDFEAREAARLVRLAVPANENQSGFDARTIRRWLGGYSAIRANEKVTHPALWTPQIGRVGDTLHLGFRDLIQLNFVRAFQREGVGLPTIKRCLERAQTLAEDERPFATRRFRTDGNTIFARGAEGIDEADLIDLKTMQQVFDRIISPSFRDLEFRGDQIARWFPLGLGKRVVVDPERSFGQPIDHETGVPTQVLAEAVDTEGSIERAALVYDVPIKAVREALAFQRRLDAA